MTERRLVSTLSDVERQALAERMDITAPVAARLLGIGRRWLRRLLKQHAAALGPPQYRKIRRRKTRLLTLAEVDTLKRLMREEAMEDARRAHAVKRNPT